MPGGQPATPPGGPPAGLPGGPPAGLPAGSPAGLPAGSPAGLPAGLDHLVLVGLMGAGKTTVGILVAARLGLPFRDGDAMLEAATGRTAAAILDAEGAEALHREERRVLAEGLAAAEPSVIAAAAAVVDDPPSRAALRARGVAVAWLRADAAVLGRRFAAAAGGEGAYRPAYGEDPTAFLGAQARRRAARFSACRPLVVLDTRRLDAETAAERIVAAVWSAAR